MLTGKELKRIGFPQGPAIGLAKEIMTEHYQHLSKDEMLEILSSILQSPNQYAGNKHLSKIAEALIPKPDPNADLIPLKEKGINFSIYGAEGIEQGALQQMNIATRIPIALAGALMPDAHQGYGLPIGGVLATDNAVIPYGVGVDIGCRMCLSIFDLPIRDLDDKEPFFTRELKEATLFGSGQEFKKPHDHDVLHRTEFSETTLLRSLKEKARKQVGSSGSGNHFVEFGIIEIGKGSFENIPEGKYIGLLSHSGSRGLGATIANHYTKLAKEKRKLVPEAANLAWLSLDEEEGMEYWRAMNLAGDYASACHHIIHAKIAKSLGTAPIQMVENHHNFAWKEKIDGKDAIVHRKGATPAGKGVLGIIPGSMASPGFIVKGRGETSSVNSASHGAGRKMSRTVAIKSITHDIMQSYLRDRGIKLIGGGLDEAPMAYKDINEVMRAQEDLVDILGTFHPRIVRMDG